MNLNDLKNQIRTLETKAYNLKTKKAKERAYENIHKLRRDALGYLYKQVERHGPSSIKATVKCFRPGNKHFLVETAYGNMWVSPCGDVLTKSWYPHTCCIEYTVGQEIVLEINTEVNSDRLFLEIIPGKIHGGTVNETQYAELCKNTKLAFFKYPNTDGVTGLFA